ncbi:DUF1398 family protein [Kribbella sp. NPDC055071]
MFTLDQVNEIHDRLGSADTLGAYLLALREIGVQKAESYLSDGHTVYRGADGYTVTTPAAHDLLTVAEVSDRDGFLGHLRQQTSYVEMSEGLARSGVEKWVFDTDLLTIAYFDRSGNELLNEPVG